MPLPFLVLGICALTGLISLLPAGLAFGQAAFPDQGTSASDLARAVVANEIKAQEGNQKHWMYRVDREQRGQTKTTEVIQTSQGSLDRLIAFDGRLLNAEEQQEESDRIENLSRNPAEQHRLEQTKRKDAEQCKAFFKMIPDALSFSYAGRNGSVIKLSYRPNPRFQPPSHEARVFHEI